MTNRKNCLCGFSITELLITIFFVLVIMGTLIGIDSPFVLTFGWLFGLFHFFRGMAIEPVAVLIGLVAAGLFVFFLHKTIRALKRDWPVRRSICIAGILLAVSISSVSMVAVIHHVYWLKKMTHYYEYHSAIYRIKTTNYIKENVLGIGNYQEKYHCFPAGGTVRKEGDLDHSWMTRLLPFLGQPYLDGIKLYESIHLDQSWKAPENKSAFSVRVSNYTPQYDYWKNLNKTHNSEGYALAGIAANEHVLPTGGVLMDINKIPDGSSYTILMGEVSQALRPWGDPINARDPCLGVDSNPYGFGNSLRSGDTIFGFCDGHISILNPNIDPTVLRALSTPNGGEKIDMNALD